MDYKTIQEQFEDALLNMHTAAAETLVYDFVAQKSRDTFFSGILHPVLQKIGEGWTSGDIALSQVYMSGRICEKIVANLFADQQPIVKNTFNIGIVNFADYHALGKRIIYSQLFSLGYGIIDLGSLQTIEEVVASVRKHQLRILLVSVLMLHAALKIKELVGALKENNIDCKILVGGALFSLDQGFHQKIGADAWAPDGVAAAAIIDQWSRQMQ